MKREEEIRQYLKEYDEPLWVEMFDPEISKVISKS